MTSVEDRLRQARAAVLEQSGSEQPGSERSGAAEAPAADGPSTPAWVDVLPERDLRREVGVPALVGDRAVAVFRTHLDELYAVSNYDPATGASVMARGIVGTRGDVPVVASPMYKHVFDLRTGRCLDDDSKCLTPYEIRVEAGVVQVRPHGARGAQGDGPKGVEHR